jgi:hypothetical protein
MLLLLIVVLFAGLASLAADQTTAPAPVKLAVRVFFVVAVVVLSARYLELLGIKVL